MPTKAWISWIPSWRIIADAYPPLNFFDRIADPADWEVLLELEKLTNPSFALTYRQHRTYTA